MDSPAQLLTQQEDAIFTSLANDPAFAGRLYRDGIPRPDIYLSQRVRVIFVFREPNLSGRPFDMDMRAQLRDDRFRAARDKELLSPGRVRGWWNNKVGALAHAVIRGLSDGDVSQGFQQFETSMTQSDAPRSHQFLFPFGYVQIKKIGGGGVSRAPEIKEHARLYHNTLLNQLALYEPDIVIGCGRGAGSPARLLHRYILPSDDQRTATSAMFTWWRYPRSARPVALLEFNHPSFRGLRQQQYRLLASAVREIAAEVGLNP